jgi:hypothetical protein
MKPVNKRKMRSNIRYRYLVYYKFFKDGVKMYGNSVSNTIGVEGFRTNRDIRELEKVLAKEEGVDKVIVCNIVKLF